MDKFARLIKEFDRELRDLKTTARRGLGAMQFYQKTEPVQKTGTSINIDIYIVLASTSDLPAFLTVYTPLAAQVIETVDGVLGYTVNQAAASGSSTTWSGSVIVTSSARINRIEVTVS